MENEDLGLESEMGNGSKSCSTTLSGTCASLNDMKLLKY